MEIEFISGHANSKLARALFTIKQATRFLQIDSMLNMYYVMLRASGKTASTTLVHQRQLLCFIIVVISIHVFAHN